MSARTDAALYRRTSLDRFCGSVSPMRRASSSFWLSVFPVVPEDGRVQILELIRHRTKDIGLQQPQDCHLFLYLVIANGVTPSNECTQRQWADFIQAQKSVQSQKCQS
jgi:hypothetical protein